MVRLIGFIVGLGFVTALLFALGNDTWSWIAEPPEETVEHRFHHHPHDPGGGFTHRGPFGTFDRQQLQRGFQVYKEVCAACHSLQYVSFRNLADLGFTEAEVDAIASQWQTGVPSINEDTGEAETREALASDRFPLVYPNEQAARAANNNAVPPDLSLITKARHNGPAYIYSLLTGYENPPAELPEEARPGAGLYYNSYFANLNIAMAPPLSDGQVSYADGTEATVDQMAEDVAAFLTWTAEPNMESRKTTGWAVLIFLVFATLLAWFAYQNVWRDTEH